MSTNLLASAVEFAENPDARCPCVLLLDVSGSMNGAPIDALNAGLRAFKDDLSKDSLAARRVEVALVAFDHEVVVHNDFSTIDNFTPPHLTTREGLTHTGTAVLKALDMIAARKAVYRENDVSYYRPWVFLITDGVPYGEDAALFEEAVRRVHEDENNKRVAFFCVGVQGADMDVLARLCVPARPPVKLDGLNFVDMFVWLSKSTGAVAASKEGEMVALPMPGWTKV